MEICSSFACNAHPSQPTRDRGCVPDSAAIYRPTPHPAMSAMGLELLNVMKSPVCITEQ